MSLILRTERAPISHSWTLNESTVSIGRGDDNLVCVPDPTVSKQHALLTLTGEKYVVTDLGSRNGTRVNGVPIGGGRALADGDLLEIGHATLRVGPPSAAPAPSEQTGAGFKLPGAGGVPEVAGGDDPSIVMNASALLQRLAGDTPKGAGQAEERLVVRVLLEAGRTLGRPLPENEIADELLRLVEQVVIANRIVLLVRPEGSDELRQAAARERGAGTQEALVLSRSIRERVLTECAAVVTRDAASDPRFEASASIVATGVRAAMAVPLFDNEEVLGLLYADSRDLFASYGENELEMLTVLANMAAIKIRHVRLMAKEAERARMVQELATASRIQQRLLPKVPKDWPACQVAARLDTCYEVGGDLYDFHRRENGTCIVLVGDVSGKGLGAALYVSSLVAAARAMYDTCAGPADLAARLSTLMERQSRPGQFVTLFIGFYDPATGEWRYANAGHNPPLLVAGTDVKLLEATGLPVGAFPGFPYTEEVVTCPPGGTLVLFSDGVVEAAHNEQMYGDERLEELVRRECAADASADRFADSIVSDVATFLSTSPRGDDTTVVVVRRPL